MKRLGGRSVGLIECSAVVLFLSCGAARPQTAELPFGPLNHRAFTAVDGAPSDIAALAQTPDGTLWIGGRTGLTRFDGVRFVPYPGDGEEPLGSTNVTSLLATPDGGLWVGFRPAGVALLQRGRVTRYGTQDGLPGGAVQQFAQDPDGSLWAAARSGLARFDGQRWETVADAAEVTDPYGVLVDRAGTLWVASANGLLARAAGESRFRAVDTRPYSDPAGTLLTATDDHIWAAANDGLVRVPTATDAEHDDVVTVRGIAGGPLLLDRDGTLWASDADEKSLLRLPARDLPHVTHREALADPARFSRADGLALGRVYALFEDREQNVWVGTNAGLHRLSRSNVVRDVAPPCLQYEFTAAAFVPGDAGSLWVACADGSDAYVYEIRDGGVVSRQITPFFTVAYRDPEGTIWFGGPTALGHLETGRIVTTPLPPELQGRPINALLREGSGALWVSVSRRGDIPRRRRRLVRKRRPRRSAGRGCGRDHCRRGRRALVRLLEQSDRTRGWPCRAVVRYDARSRRGQRLGDPRARRRSLGRRGARFRTFRRQRASCRSVAHRGRRSGASRASSGRATATCG